MKQVTEEENLEKIFESSLRLFRGFRRLWWLWQGIGWWCEYA
jgi:hypothetical protein